MNNVNLGKYDASKIDFIINKIKSENNIRGLLHQIMYTPMMTHDKEPVFTIYFTDKTQTALFRKFIRVFSSQTYIISLKNNITNMVRIVLPLGTDKTGNYFWQDGYDKKHEYILLLQYVPWETYRFTTLYHSSPPLFLQYIEKASKKKGYYFTPNGFHSIKTGLPIKDVITERLFKEFDTIPFNQRNVYPIHKIPKNKQIWVRGNYNESCNKTCSRVNKKCMYKDMRNLRKTKKINQIALQTGTKCKKYAVTTGPPSLEDYGGKGCWVSDGKNGELCSEKSKHWGTNVCSCK